MGVLRFNSIIKSLDTIGEVRMPVYFNGPTPFATNALLPKEELLLVRSQDPQVSQYTEVSEQMVNRDTNWAYPSFVIEIPIPFALY